MITAKLIFILAFPIAIYFFYARPKAKHLLQVSLAAILCNAIIHLFLLLPPEQHNKSPASNIDYTSIASISKRYDVGVDIDPSVHNTIETDQKLYKQKSIDKNIFKNADILCSDCDRSVWGQEPDFSYAPAIPNFIWPAQGKIIKSFNVHDNEGINISIPFGSEIKSTESGKVTYAGEKFASYGKLVIISHPHGYISTYAHNSELLVDTGDRVFVGQVIARSGESGSVVSPQLHFELRKGIVPLDPVKFMPRT